MQEDEKARSPPKVGWILHFLDVSHRIREFVAVVAFDWPFLASIFMRFNKIRMSYASEIRNSEFQCPLAADSFANRNVVRLDTVPESCRSRHVILTKEVQTR